MADRTTETNPLAALGAHLGAHGFTVQLTERGLKVADPQVSGCCDRVGRAADTITCRPRPEDAGADWFFTSWNQPIAPADRIIDAKVVILGYLAGEGGR